MSNTDECIKVQIFDGIYFTKVFGFSSEGIIMNRSIPSNPRSGRSEDEEEETLSNISSFNLIGRSPGKSFPEKCTEIPRGNE